MKDKELLLFTTPICPSCKLIKPVLAKLQERHQFKLRIVELTAETKSLFIQYNIRSAPTLTLLVDGEKEALFPGFFGEKVLVDRLVQWGVIGEEEAA